MPRPPIYCDMDHVLVLPIIDPFTDEAKDIEIRPDVEWFLESLSRYGDVSLMSQADRGWVNFVVSKLGKAARFLKQKISRQDLAIIDRQIERVNEKNLPIAERDLQYLRIAPILPAGVIFDDYPVGSWMFWLKSVANGTARTGGEMWIEVDPFLETIPEMGGLRRAFAEFERRNAVWRVKPPALGFRTVPLR